FGAQPANVDDQVGLGQALLHAVDEVDAAALEHRERVLLVGEQVGRFLERARLREGEPVHDLPPSPLASAARIRSGVMGISRTGLPMGLKMAHATAPQVATMGGSPMPRTPVWPWVQRTVSILGMS